MSTPTGRLTPEQEKWRLTRRDLDEIAAQADASSPYYLPRLLAMAGLALNLEDVVMELRDERDAVNGDPRVAQIDAGFKAIQEATGGELSREDNIVTDALMAGREFASRLAVRERHIEQLIQEAATAAQTITALRQQVAQYEHNLALKDADYEEHVVELQTRAEQAERDRNAEADNAGELRRLLVTERAEAQRLRTSLRKHAIIPVVTGHSGDWWRCLLCNRQWAAGPIDCGDHPLNGLNECALAAPPREESPQACGATHGTGAVCELPTGHTENHKGQFDHGIAQWPREE